MKKNLFIVLTALALTHQLNAQTAPTATAPATQPSAVTVLSAPPQTSTPGNAQASGVPVQQQQQQSIVIQVSPSGDLAVNGVFVGNLQRGAAAGIGGTQLQFVSSDFVVCGSQVCARAQCVQYQGVWYPRTECVAYENVYYPRGQCELVEGVWYPHARLEFVGGVWRRPGIKARFDIHIPRPVFDIRAGVR